MEFNVDDLSRFSNFNIITKTYKVVNDHQIELDILFPKSLSAASFPDGRGAPVLLRFHGGGLSAGSSLFPPFFAPWLLELAERYSAVIATPNYRLIPESAVQDAIDDADDAFLWVRNSFQSQVGGEIPFPVDVSRILTTGDSAGAYLALDVALSHPDEVRSTIAAYPTIEVDSPHFVGRYEKQVLSLPSFSAAIVEEHLAKLKSEESGKIVSADPQAERIPLMFSLVQHGLLGEFFPAEQRRIFPLMRLDDGHRFPRGGVIVMHGENDTVVPVEGSFKLRDKVAELDPDLDFSLVVRPGEHGFDHQINLKEPWVTESLEGVIKAWIS